MRKPRGQNTTGKTTGYVVVPLFAGGADDQTLEEAVHSEGFDEIADVINALQEHDGDLVDIIKSMRIQKGEGRPIDRGPWRKKIDFLAPKVELEELYESISSEICDRLGANWYEWLGRLKAYKEREGDCRVRADHEDGDGFNLGRWVHNQRGNAVVGKLSAERVALLDELGFVWDPFEADWNNGYEHLKAYKAREGDCQVRADHEDGDGFNLGTWVHNQRGFAAVGKLSAERIALLDELGFVWDPNEEDWNNGYEHLKAYKAREGDCQVRADHKDGDGYNLGTWVHNQRRDAAVGKLSAERIALLDELGFVWKVR